jgi:hypothetical protein
VHVLAYSPNGTTTKTTMPLQNKPKPKPKPKLPPGWEMVPYGKDHPNAGLFYFRNRARRLKTKHYPEPPKGMAEIQKQEKNNGD